MDADAAEELKGFGLSSYESAAYAALLRLGAADANLVSQKAKIPFGRVYDVLNSLVDRGLLILHEGRPKQYSAVQPRVALSLLLSQRKRELDDRYAEMTRLASDLEKRLSPKVKEEYFAYPSESIGWGRFGTGRGGSAFACYRSHANIWPNPPNGGLSLLLGGRALSSQNVGLANARVHDLHQSSTCGKGRREPLGRHWSRRARSPRARRVAFVLRHSRAASKPPTWCEDRNGGGAVMLWT